MTFTSLSLFILLSGQDAGRKSSFSQVVIVSSQAVVARLSADQFAGGLTRIEADALFPSPRFVIRELDGLIAVIDTDSRHLRDIRNSDVVYQWFASLRSGGPLQTDEMPNGVRQAINELIADRVPGTDTADAFAVQIQTTTKFSIKGGSRTADLEVAHNPNLETLREWSRKLQEKPLATRAAGEQTSERGPSSAREVSLTAVLRGDRAKLANEFGRAMECYVAFADDRYRDMLESKGSYLRTKRGGLSSHPSEINLQTGKLEELPLAVRQNLERQLAMSPSRYGFASPEEAFAFLTGGKIATRSDHVWIRVAVKNGSNTSFLSIGLL